MKLKMLALSGLICVAAAPMAMAEIVIKDAYARSSGPMAKAGAAFMVIENTGAMDDRLIAARADVSKRVELHTHIDDGNGVMKMREVEGGFAVPAGGNATLARGGDHVMFMGLTQAFEQDMVFPVTLVFEQAGEITVEVPVDLNRAATMGHGAMTGNGHGNMKMSN